MALVPLPGGCGLQFQYDASLLQQPFAAPLQRGGPLLLQREPLRDDGAVTAPQLRSIAPQPLHVAVSPPLPPDSDFLRQVVALQLPHAHELLFPHVSDLLLLSAALRFRRDVAILLQLGHATPRSTFALLLPLSPGFPARLPTALVLPGRALLSLRGVALLLAREHAIPRSTFRHL